MFYNSILNTKFSGTVADGLFPNISARKFRDDVSLETTLRILLDGKLQEGETVKASFNDFNFSIDTIRDVNVNALADAIVTPGDSLEFISFSGVDEALALSFEKADEGLKPRGFEPDVKLSEAISTHTKFKVVIYLNREEKHTIVLVERLDLSKLHILQSFIPRYLPWYFESITKDAMDFIRTLTRKTSDEYTVAVAAAASKYDFESGLIRSALRGFEKSHLESRLETIKNDMTGQNRALENLRARFAEIYRKIQELEIRHAGVLAKLSDDTDENDDLMDYFLSNNHIHLVSVHDGSVRFYVTTTLHNYDPDVAESVINSDRSWVYYRIGSFTTEQVKRLMTAIFVENRFSVRVCAAFELNFRYGDYKGVSRFEFDPDVLESHTPNMHIQQFSCLGGNESQIYESVLAHNYVGAIMACEASAANLNFNDSAVGELFDRNLFERDANAFLVSEETGELLTPKQALAILEKEDK